MELLVTMNAMHAMPTRKWETWQKVLSAYGVGSYHYKTTVIIFSRTIAKIEEAPSNSPSEEVSESKSLDKEPERPLEVLELLHLFTLESETEITAL